MSEKLRETPGKWRRRFWCLLVFWVGCTFLFSFPEIRGLLILPLVVSDSDASGDIAYVMADGAAYWERLRAASDLYHLSKVKEIYLLEENKNAGWNFVRQQSDSQLQRGIDYLILFGVPSERIGSVPQRADNWLGSRSEAVGLASLSEEFDRIVVVTSPPHTRRAKMVFQRVFKSGTTIKVFSAAAPHQSVECYAPIWLEYVKLVVYWFVA